MAAYHSGTPVTNVQAGRLTRQTLDTHPGRAAVPAHGTYQKRTIGAQRVECGVLPGCGYGRKHTQSTGSTLQEQLLYAGRGRKWRLDYRACLCIEGVRLHVAGCIEKTVQTLERSIAIAEQCIHRCTSRKRIT